jgi:hypothetical protein
LSESVAALIMALVRSLADAIARVTPRRSGICASYRKSSMLGTPIPEHTRSTAT